MKLAFIVQRYGREILGGSETLARQLAERLSRRHEITVLTTTAKDYITWKNEFEPGEEKLRGVKIIRFPVEGERDIDDFNKFSEEIYKGDTSRERELEWLERQGPVTPELVDYLKKEHQKFDLLVFFTYLYYPTFYGLQVAPEKSVLLPTAHDEPPLKLGIFKEMFQLPSSYLFNTEAEELLVIDRFPVHKKMRETIGMGMELLDQPDPSIFRKAHDVSGKYFLYAGRIDGGKGMEELFRYFTFYKEEHPASGNLQLILIGKLGMKLPDDQSIRYAGFVDEAEKLAAMAGAVAVLQPSKMESLSIVTLEALSVGTPVLVNGASPVLVDHCKKANAGFYYRDFEEFEEIVHLLLTDKNLARNLGKNGQRYIKENYGWQKLLNKYELALRASGRPTRESKEGRRREPPPSKRDRRERGRRDETPPRADDAAPATVETIPAEPAESVETPPESSQAAPNGASSAEEVVAEEVVAEELIARELVAEDVVADELVSEDLATDEAVSEDLATDEVVSEDLATDEAVSEDLVTDEAVSEDLVTDEVVAAADAVLGVEDTREFQPVDAEPPPVDAVSEDDDPDATIALDTSLEPVQSPEREPEPEPEPELEPEPEPAAEPLETESEDAKHLPSFYRAALPAKKTPPASLMEKERTPTPRTEPLPPPAAPADGSLPEFFRPKPKVVDEPPPASIAKPESPPADETSS